MTQLDDRRDHRLFGPLADPAGDAGHEQHPKRVGFFTDTSICIGCKACEVACKTWNAVPEDGLNFLGMSYDNTGMLGANTWRHVAFIEQARPLGRQESGVASAPTGPAASAASAAVTAAGITSIDSAHLGTEPVPDVAAAARAAVDAGTLPPAPFPAAADGARDAVRWLMSSDVCKHCTHAACLDVCPTGSLFRTEFGTVVVQEDICNGCGYCIPACPYGVIDRREEPVSDGKVGLAQKCTLCYDRLHDGLTPACAQACPTESIQFGELDQLRARAARRLEALHDGGLTEARLYGEDPDDGVGGAGAFFLLLDEPEVYGFPPDPVVTTRDLPAMWRSAALAGAGLLAAAAAAFVGRRA